MTYSYFLSLTVRDRLQAQVQPIMRPLLRIELSIVPDFCWDENIHGTAETFLILVENMSMGRLFFSRIQVCRHYVSFSNLFKVSKESDPAQLLLLNCFILGDKPSTSFKPNETFPVEVQKTKNVGILKDLIKEKKSHRLKHVSPVSVQRSLLAHFDHPSQLESQIYAVRRVERLLVRRFGSRSFDATRIGHNLPHSDKLSRDRFRAPSG